jgi:hypothetical protein
MRIANQLSIIGTATYVAIQLSTQAVHRITVVVTVSLTLFAAIKAEKAIGIGCQRFLEPRNVAWGIALWEQGKLRAQCCAIPFCSLVVVRAALPIFGSAAAVPMPIALPVLAVAGFIALAKLRQKAIDQSRGQTLFIDHLNQICPKYWIESKLTPEAERHCLNMFYSLRNETVIDKGILKTALMAIEALPIMQSTNHIARYNSQFTLTNQDGSGVKYLKRLTYRVRIIHTATMRPVAETEISITHSRKEDGEVLTIVKRGSFR